jgi:hypothetical protein
MSEEDTISSEGSSADYNESLSVYRTDETKLVLKVEIENYVQLKSSRLVTIIVSPHTTVLETLLQIAKKPNVAISVDNALHNYFLFIPNADSIKKDDKDYDNLTKVPHYDRKAGIVLKNEHTLGDYGLKFKVCICLFIVFIT